MWLSRIDGSNRNSRQPGKNGNADRLVQSVLAEELRESGYDVHFGR